MANPIVKLTTDAQRASYFGGGFTLTERLMETYRPQNPARFREYGELIKTGRLQEALWRQKQYGLQEAMITDDLPVILGGGVDLTIRKAYGNVSQNWRQCFRTGKFSNFREQKIANWADLDVDNPVEWTPRSASLLDMNTGIIPIVGENEMYRDARLSEEYENAQLETYGTTFMVTRHMMYNDDLDQLSIIPQGLGVAMARTLNWTVAFALCGGTNSRGATLRSGNQLFDATNHGNLQTTNTPLTHANCVQEMTSFVGQTTPMGRELGLQPRYLIIPPALQFQAERILADASRLVGTTTSDTLKVDANILPSHLTMVIMNEIALIGSASEYSWYLACDPNEYPTIDVAFLNGRQTPELFQKNETGLDLHSADGTQYKIRHDFDAYPVDYRGLRRVEATTLGT